MMTRKQMKQLILAAERLNVKMFRTRLAQYQAGKWRDAAALPETGPRFHL